MIFALLDYWQYRRLPGRYGILHRESVIRFAFRGSLPEELIEVLRPGDAIFVQTLNSFLSWSVMYLTKSEFSHVATYMGNSLISHATTSGLVIEPIAHIFSPDALILPCSLKLSEEESKKLADFHRANEGRPYSWSSVIRKGVRILTGREPWFFRWTFIADLIIVLGLLDILLFMCCGIVGALWCVVLYLSIVAFRSLVSRNHQLPLDATIAKPVDLYLIALERGGIFHLKLPNDQSS